MKKSKAKRFAEFGDDASVTTVKITRRGRFSNCWAFPILECNYYTMDRIQKLLSRNHKNVKILCPEHLLIFPADNGNCEALGIAKIVTYDKWPKMKRDT